MSRQKNIQKDNVMDIWLTKMSGADQWTGGEGEWAEIEGKHTVVPTGRMETLPV